MTTHPNLAAALIAAQQAFAPIVKDNRANTGKFSYTYADLGSVLDAVTPALHENGLVILQPLGISDGKPTVWTLMRHADSDDEITSETLVTCADYSDPQKVGGGITYARRYALMAMLCLNAEDDDGQHARTPAPSSHTTTRPKFPQADPETGEIIDEDKVKADKVKAEVIKQIMVIAGKIGQDDDTIKEAMRWYYRNSTDPKDFSRKDLHIDELTEFKDKMQARLNKVLAQRGRA